MVRRDRNHACIFLWEPILNETWYPDYFAKKVRDIVKEEFPYKSSYSACDYRSKGREFFNIWYENAINFSKNKPSYSDTKTENITFLQREWGDCVDDWMAHNGPSRVSRQWGEIPMLIQANHYAQTNFHYICYNSFFKPLHNSLEDVYGIRLIIKEVIIQTHSMEVLWIVIDNLKLLTIFSRVSVRLRFKRNHWQKLDRLSILPMK